MSEQHKSVYKSSADDGFILGAYLSVWFLLLGYSTENVYLAPLAMLMMLGVPVLIFFMLRRAYVRAYGLSQFSELWLQENNNFCMRNASHGCCRIRLPPVSQPWIYNESGICGSRILRIPSWPGSAVGSPCAAGHD